MLHTRNESLAMAQEDVPLTYLLTHSMVQSPSWEANRFAASQEIPRISRNPKVHYRTHKRPPPVTWASPIQSIYPHPTFRRSILILSTHLRLGLPSGLFPSAFPTTTLYTPPLLTHTRHMPSPSHSSRFYHPHNIGWGLCELNSQTPEAKPWRSNRLHTSKSCF